MTGLFDKFAHRDNHIINCMNAYDQKQYQLAASSCLLAKDSGNGEVLRILGTLYELEKGVPQDYKKAEYYLKLSTNQGNTGAIELLDILFK